jgi:hypothetical protein
MLQMPRNIPQTEDDFLSAQQEAIRRVREMQARARHTLESAGMHLQPPASPRPRAQPLSEHTTQAEHEANSQANRPPNEVPDQNRNEPIHETAEARRQPQKDDGLHIPLISDIVSGNFLKLPVELLNISLDSEQIMILILLYVLYTDKADPYLMIALAYVLL